MVSWLSGTGTKGTLEALALARQLSHPFSLAWALSQVARLHYLRREEQAVQKCAEAQITLSGEQGFPYWLSVGTIVRGWALAEQEKKAEGILQMRQGLAAHRATESNLDRPYYLAMLADAYGKAGQGETGLHVVAEALEAVDRTEKRFYEAELYRLKGELTLQKEARDWRLETSLLSSQASSLKPQVSNGVAEEAEECFLKAIAIAQRQQAKSLELRAATSLARLWQQQDKRASSQLVVGRIQLVYRRI